MRYKERSVCVLFVCLFFVCLFLVCFVWFLFGEGFCIKSKWHLPKLSNAFFNKWSASQRKQIVLLIADLFLHSYEAGFIADLIRKKEHRFARSLNLSFCYIDDVLSLASYLDLHLEVDGTGNYGPNFTTNVMTFHSECSQF